MNSELNNKRGVTREGEFCTGADFIEQKYVSFGFSVSIGKIQ
jgi:hypothetical protein